MPREVVRISNFYQALKKDQIGDLLKFYALKLNKKIHIYNNAEGEVRTSFGQSKSFSTSTILVDVNNLSEITDSRYRYKTIKVFDKEYNSARLKFLTGPRIEDEKSIKDQN